MNTERIQFREHTTVEIFLKRRARVQHMYMFLSTSM